MVNKFEIVRNFVETKFMIDTFSVGGNRRKPTTFDYRGLNWKTFSRKLFVKDWMGLFRDEVCDRDFQVYIMHNFSRYVVPLTLCEQSQVKQ